MAYKAVILRPKTQISATGTAWVANTVLDFSEKWPTEPVSRLYPILYGDNVTDEATVAELVDELIQRVYIKSATKGVIVDLSGADLVAVNRLLFHSPFPAVFGGGANDQERAISPVISFGRSFLDPAMGLPALPMGDVTAQITMGTSANVDGADYAIHAELIPGMAPAETFQYLTTNITPLGVGAEAKYRLPETGRYRALILFGTTPKVTISSYRLYLDDNFMEMEDTALSLLARGHYSAKLGSYLGKFAIYEKVPTAAADGGPASLPAALEDGALLMNYQLIDFGEDPGGWLDVRGHKFEIGLTFGDTNAVRIISVIGYPIG